MHMPSQFRRSSSRGHILLCLAVLVLCPQWRTCHSLLVSDHPDRDGLLALKASICGSNCSALVSWNETSQVCSQLGFEGVYCAWVEGEWRAVSVHLQLEVSTVLFNDSQLKVGGSILGIQYLRELEVLCYRDVVAGPAAAPADVQAMLSAPTAYSSTQLNQNASETIWDSQVQPSQYVQVHVPYTSSSNAAAHPSSHSIVAGSASHQFATGLTRTAAAVGDLPPSWFLAYPSLQQLRVTGCGASGQLPVELLSAKGLTSLVLSRNKITGTLPDGLVQLQHLTLLDLSSNKLSGTLPAIWSALPQLSYLYLNQNNITLSVLPCEWADMPSLMLADISGNQYQPAGTGAGPGPGNLSTAGCWSAQPTAGAVTTRRTQLGSTADTGTNSQLRRAPKFGVLRGPRCWLRRFCYQEGAFICLQRSSKHASGGCTSYIYGASDLHIDPANQCDHGGTHLVAIAGIWMALLAALLLIYLHHCRLLRRLTNPPEQRRWRQQQQQQWQGAPHQRQWLVTTGPAASPRAIPSTAGTTAANDATLPLLYYAAASHEDAAGYARPASPGACSLDAAMAETEGFLPSALHTPPVTTTRVMVVRGLGASANAYEYGSDHSGSSPGYSTQGGLSRLGRPAGPVSRLSGRQGSGRFGSVGDSTSSCFSPELLVPLAFALLDITTDVRLLVLWGIWPHEVKLWPSYVLVGFILLPHVLVGAIVHFRLLAAACLPPAVQAASAPVETDILPPGSRAIILLYSWLFSAPWWLAYPLILMLLVPGIALLAVLCPLTLLLHAFGISSHGAVVKYVQLMQGCIALTEAPGTAALLTALFLMGNMPLEYAFLDGSLYYLNVVASMMDICAAWWVKLDGVRQQQLMQLAEASIPPAGIWS